NIPLPTDSISNNKLDYLKTQLKNVNGITNISFSANTPIENTNNTWGNFYFNHAIKLTDFYSIIKAADNDYVSTYKLSLIAGRNLAPADTMKEVLVNEMLLKNLGITNPQNVLNKGISFSDGEKGIIVGVLKDFQTLSFH